MPGQGQPESDPLVTMIGPTTGRIYHCPDLAAVDQHLRELVRVVASLGHLPDLVGAYRDDIDRLLARRSWLMLPVDPGARECADVVDDDPRAAVPRPPLNPDLSPHPRL
jgi:hypothetical protein